MSRRGRLHRSMTMRRRWRCPGESDKYWFFFFQAEDGIRDIGVTGVQTCALPIFDEILVHVTPVLLGDGVRLFSRPGGGAIKLERTSVREIGQLTALRFSVRDRARR